jgi:steroid delta-isomerase-like uncharacterized protein
MNQLIAAENKRHIDGRKAREAVMKTAGAHQRTVQAVVAALENGKLMEAVDLFDDQFTFTDHALELEFAEKERLTEFFQKGRELFPDTVIVTDAITECGETVVLEWTLTAAQAEPFWGGTTRRIPITLRGVSVLQVEDGKIIRWADYYDRTTSRRAGLAAVFQEWVEY